MWLARCSYINQLVDPLQLDGKLKPIYKKTKVVNAKARLWCLGIGRFAQEHWILSHPLNNPCDLDPDPTFVWGSYGLTEEGSFSSNLTAAPRFDLRSYDLEAMGGPAKCTGPLNPGRIARLREMRLDEYSRLYGSLPSPSWWGWELFFNNGSSSSSSSSPRVLN
jgi:hypothetical protein